MTNFKRSLGISLWFMFLTLPLMVVKVNTLTNEIVWRWANLAWVGFGAFAIAWLWQFMIERRTIKRAAVSAEAHPEADRPTLAQRLADDPVLTRRVLLVAALVAVVFPWLVSSGQNYYHVNVMVSALIFVVLGLGLNITVGLVTSFIVSLLAIGWLLRYVSKNSFRGFAVYRIIAGLVILALTYSGFLQVSA